jgi:hypothetical protein
MRSGTHTIARCALVLVTVVLVACCQGTRDSTSSDIDGCPSTDLSAARAAVAVGTPVPNCDYPAEYVPEGSESGCEPMCPGAVLPCGSCDGTLPACRAGRTRACPGYPGPDPRGTFSPFDAWLCQCEQGAWACRIAATGASACPPPADGPCSSLGAPRACDAIASDLAAALARARDSACDPLSSAPQCAALVNLDAEVCPCWEYVTSADDPALHAVKMEYLCAGCASPVWCAPCPDTPKAYCDAGRCVPLP